MKTKKLISLLTLTLIALMAMGSLASAESKIVLKPKVDAFALFVDTSPSMAESYKATGTPKIVAGINALKQLNGIIPNLGYQSALYTMPEFTTYSPKATYNKSAIAKGLSSISTDLPFFQSTPIGGGFTDLDTVLSTWKGKMAVIFVSDGLSNAGRKPATIVSDLAKKYGDRLCLHTISVADTPEGIAVMKKLASLTPCGIFVEASALSNKAVLDKFAQDVFYTQEEELTVEIIPVPVAVVDESMQEKIVFRNLNFGFDKYQITDEMEPSLVEAAAMLESYPNLKVMVGGHTDSTGPEKYNQALSLRRAQSVATWMAKNGISKDRIVATGYGEMSPKYDNNTKEGRKLNRRVEIDVKE
ncbi:OmpA family protein [Desulfovibrio gilichinskyi]|uniref:OmpA-OmpF porin, OOP family n=1 Tax=Desulfovibrio gilichinskyi TaxID=1519643 RepID=A0A1X7CNY0_9BACT|nr:OmpA family protein [Desulfovibrio gilichinskyi]SMF00204.1 OmpA-OmpF porin, OOP family [Desulfovibrio gilichinskyi]